jgi:prepilin-type N-terminal cleavage/methylation domain-containing protein
MKKAFSLIELGIVLAIVALCAMVVVPNLADSKTRTNTASARAALRTAVVGLEAYAADNSGNYPYDGVQAAAPYFLTYNFWYLPRDLTTPVAYLQTHLIADPYRVPTTTAFNQYNNIRYVNTDSTWGTAFDSWQSIPPGTSVYYPEVLKEFGRYRVMSTGPDGIIGPGGWRGISNYPPPNLYLPYDPTNGLVSGGDIMRSQVCEFGYLNMQP